MIDPKASMDADLAYAAAWSGDYDGTDCPNCKRLRMMKCTNGKRRCEKCNWDPDAGDYSEFDPNRN
jgi:ribosomal protein L37AE/L43A